MMFLFGSKCVQRDSRERHSKWIRRVLLFNVSVCLFWSVDKRTATRRGIGSCDRYFDMLYVCLSLLLSTFVVQYVCVI